MTREAAVGTMVALLAAGMKRVTFVGGEPLLCPYFDDLARAAHDGGAEVVLATNGSKLSERRCEALIPLLDVINLSIDASDGEIMAELGRGNTKYLDYCVSLWVRLKTDPRLRLGLNTTVTKLNYMNDMNALVMSMRPERWKVFRVLPVAGQNDGNVENLLVSDSEFDVFKNRHAAVAESGIDVHFEDHDAIEATYIRLDPLGRFYVNPTGGHRYSDPVAEVGVATALLQVGWSQANPEAAFAPMRWGS